MFSDVLHWVFVDFLLLGCEISVFVHGRWSDARTNNELQGSYATVIGRHLTMPELIVVLVIRRWDRRLIKMKSRRVALEYVR